MRILLTNDDGIDAPGLAALRAALDDLGEVTTVAPLKHQSATSQAATFHRAIAVEKHPQGYAAEGRPADCVKLALGGLFADERPDGPPFDLVISGMNAGANVGVNVLYSGTVGAAREANFNGVPSIAVSLHLKKWNLDEDQWHRAAAHGRAAIDRILASGPLDPSITMNLNVPVLDDGAEPRGFAVAPAAVGGMDMQYERGVDERGRTTYRCVSTMTFRSIEPDTDVDLLFKKYVTLTPLRFDTTCPAAVGHWRSVLASSGAGRG